MAAIYRSVNTWAAQKAAGQTATIRVEQDVDLDGEQEYLLYNAHVMAVFERLGGRMIGAWMREPASGVIYQMVGNLVSGSGSETEGGGCL